MTLTGTNNYILSWLNINPEKLEIVVQYIKNLILDNGETLNRPPKRATISGEIFQKIYGLPLKEIPEEIINNLSLGELIGGLTSYGIKYTDDPEFPQSEKEQLYLESFTEGLFTTQESEEPNQ